MTEPRIIAERMMREQRDTWLNSIFSKGDLMMIDKWIFGNDPHLDRSEAIRRRVEFGLTVKTRAKMPSAAPSTPVGLLAFQTLRHLLVCALVILRDLFKISKDFSRITVACNAGDLRGIDLEITFAPLRRLNHELVVPGLRLKFLERSSRPGG